MAVTGIVLRGNAGTAEARTIQGSEVQARVQEFVQRAPGAGSTTRLVVDAQAIGLTREYNQTWTVRFDAQVFDGNGARLTDRKFAGRYDPELGGIEVREVTHEAFAIAYHKDTRG